MTSSSNLIIAVDFDQTISDARYPAVGVENPGAIEWLRKYQEHGARLILWTMRSGQSLRDAIDWCRDQGLDFWAYNKNHKQSEWTDSPKAYAHIYIDDAAFGCPLRLSEKSKKFCVDWDNVGPAVLSRVMHETRKGG